MTTVNDGHTPTPRTDAQEKVARDFFENQREIDWPSFDGAPYDFARTLETELASSLATIEALRGALRAMTKYAEYYASDLHSEASERYTGATAARIISEANGIKKECEESRALLSDQPAEEERK
jgi:hypothetical protein